MIQCLIVDDEPIARQILETYCRHLPHLHVAASCSNALEAKTELQKQPVDILFLDINMPVLDGLAFLKTLRNPPQVIFTTAYKEFAIDAFDLAACDYLLKPFSFERFIVAVDRATALLSKPVSVTTDVRTATPETVFIRYEGKIYHIRLDEILYAEAAGNNTRIVTVKDTLAPVMTFSAVEALLPRPAFLRVHRSFLVSRAHIGHIEGNRIFIRSHEIPIGNHYRDEFFREVGLNG